MKKSSPAFFLTWLFYWIKPAVFKLGIYYLKEIEKPCARKNFLQMKSKRYLPGILILLMMVSVASAASGPEITGYQSGSLTIDKTYRYHTSLLDDNLQPAKEKKPRDIEIDYSVSFDYVFKWRLSVLMGEPIVIGWVSYKPTDISTPVGFVGSGISFGINGEDLLNKIHLTEFKMKVHMFVQPPGQRAFDHGAGIIIDAGAPGKPYFGHSSSELTKKGKLFSKFSSFNVPGSPDWNELFINIKDEQQAKKYFTDLSNAARKRDRYYAAYYKHEVVKFDVDTNAIEHYINKYLSSLEKGIRDKEKAEQKEKQATELDDALDEIETASSRTDDFLSEESANGTETLDDLLEETEKITLTLHDIPEKTRANVITISGRVENVSSIDSSEIVFKVNGLEQPVYLAQDGSFSNKVVLFNGENTIDVEYNSTAGQEHKRVTVTSTTPPVKARFTLTWDSGSSDMDLHVEGPNGDHCSYNNKMTTNMQLDVDNTSGYGPENVSVKLNQHPGIYRVYVNHYGGHSSNVTLYIYLDNRLVATEKSFLSSGRWHAYDLEIN